jgi:Fur family transcriptional regulator, iron response regulator
MIANETILTSHVRKSRVMESRPFVVVNKVSADARPTDPGSDERNGCPWHDVLALLRQVKLRPTRQRMALG